MSPDELLRLQLRIEPHLHAIEEIFVQDVRLTLICRLPGNDEADVLMTRDDLDAAINVIQRRKNQKPTNEPKDRP